MNDKTTDAFLALLVAPEGRKKLTAEMQKLGHIPVTGEEYGCCIPNGKIITEPEIIEVNGKTVGCDLGEKRDG